MAQTAEGELVDRFEQFFRNYYRDDIGQLAQNFPGDQQSLWIDWADLYQFDADLADDYLAKPDQLREYAEEALRLYDLPVDVNLGQAHVRIQNLPDVTEIRAIRSPDINTLVSVQGIIRKATDVRPKIEEAAFECQRCGTLSYIPQTAGFQEPHECQGCERQGPFSINYDQSQFVDAQKIRVQERPEGLRGGETPQSIDVNVEADLTGKVAPGDYVTVTGVLRIDQQESNNQKSRMFDVYMDGHSLSMEDVEFEEMDISEADKQAILDLSESEGIYERMVQSIAPSIWGYEEEKLAIAMQLFSGVTKNLPDDSRIRGDIHILLIGDPGTGKCVKGDTTVRLADGTRRPIGELVESNLDDPTAIDDGVFDHVDFEVPSPATDGTIRPRRASKVWKREAPDQMYRIRTASGSEIEITPSHPLFVHSNGALEPVEASELTEGRFIATPRDVPIAGDDDLEVEFRRSEAPNAVRLDLPEKWTPWLARLIGYIVAEGHVILRDDRTADIRVTNDDEAILDDVSSALTRLGLEWTSADPREHTSARHVRCNSGEFGSFLANLDQTILGASAEKRVPQPLFETSLGTKRAFLSAYIESEAQVSSSQREIAVASMSRDLLVDVRALLREFAIDCSLDERTNGSYRLRISGSDFQRYVSEIGFVTARKTDAAGVFDDVKQTTNTDVIPGLGDMMQDIRDRLALSQFDCGIPRTTYQQYERGDRNPSRSSLALVLDAFEERLDELRTLRSRIRATEDRETLRNARTELTLSQDRIADELDVCRRTSSLREQGDVATDGGSLTDTQALIRDRLDAAISASDDVSRLRTLVENDVTWDRIESIEAVDPDYEWVYDLEVQGTHSYLSNGIVSHNSQILQYIQHIAPRSVYTSGKGSSAAGLTAAAVQSDFAEGQAWTLEAGALVLADKGVAAVDELDKMDPGDRSAMHEALEQQEISISKAGITATLKSRCALLGAANPKYGRFDQYEPIAEQIELDPALISRFDLIFTVTDQPSAEEDRELADHIINSNYAGELDAQHTNLPSSNVSLEEAQAAASDVQPAIDAELLRKYVAFAKRTIFPTMTEEARDRIRDFYVDMRSQGSDEDAPVPITARKLEALVRLAEASARVRLSDTVELEDAERVIDIVRSSLQDVGMDPETGELDADVIETGTSKTQRDRIKSISSIIKELQDEFDGGVPKEEIISAGQDIGIEEDEVEHQIEKLKREGEVYEPSMDGRFRKTKD